MNLTHFISHFNQINLTHSIYNLRKNQHLYRLLSTSKTPITSDSDQSHPSNQLDETNHSISNPEDNVNHSLNQKQKHSNYYKPLAQLSNSHHLKPIKKQLGLIREKLSQELTHLPTRLSQVTGYGDIDKLKRLVSEKEAELKAGRTAAFEAKLKFNQAAQRRAESIKEVNDLLARKASWSDQDLARFTMLVRTDHANEQVESEAKKTLEQSESQVDHQFTNMMQAILTRYHEEQIWSDKIRALSTTFSLSITVINVLVFIAAILLVEPYKRSKVVSEVEERIKARDSNNAEILDRALNMVVDKLTSTEKELSELVLALNHQSNHSIIQDKLEPEQEVVTRRIEEGTEQLTSATEQLTSGTQDSSSPSIEDLSPGIKEQSEESQSSSSGTDHKLQNLADAFGRIWAHESDENLLKAVGLGTIVGIILITSFQFFSK